MEDDLLKTHPHLKEFLPYLELLRNESPRGQVLISTGFIEEHLKRTLLAFMREVPQAARLVDGANAPLGTLSARIEACYVLGLIAENEHHDLGLLRKIRNDFAHDIHTSFETPSVVDRCRQLKLKAHDYKSKEMGEVVVPPRDQFQTCAVAIITHLINRPHYVAMRRCVLEDWPF